MNWTIITTNRFEKNYSKLPSEIKENFKEKFKTFLKDPKDKSLKTHKLKWKLSEYYSHSIDYQYRFITKIESKTVILVNIWDHSIYK